MRPRRSLFLRDLEAHERHKDLTQRAVVAGVLPDEIASVMLRKAFDFYDGFRDAAKIRDEAIRSASLAAMNLMLAAHAVGLGTGPMIGFDPGAIREIFRIGDRFLPVMLVALGYRAPNNPGAKPRFDVDEVTAFNDWKAA